MDWFSLFGMDWFGLAWLLMCLWGVELSDTLLDNCRLVLFVLQLNIVWFVVVIFGLDWFGLTLYSV